MTEDICMNNPFPGLKGAFVIYSSSEGSGSADGHCFSSAFRWKGSALTSSPLSACGKGIYPPDKALPEAKRTQIPFCGCPQLRSFIVQPSDSSAWLTKSCLAWPLMSNNVFFQLLSLWQFDSSLQPRTHLGCPGEAEEAGCMAVWGWRCLTSAAS